MIFITVPVSQKKKKDSRTTCAGMQFDHPGLDMVQINSISIVLNARSNLHKPHMYLWKIGGSSRAPRIVAGNNVLRHWIKLDRICKVIRLNSIESFFSGTMTLWFPRSREISIKLDRLSVSQRQVCCKTLFSVTPQNTTHERLQPGAITSYTVLTLSCRDSQCFLLSCKMQYKGLFNYKMVNSGQKRINRITHKHSCATNSLRHGILSQ